MSEINRGESDMEDGMRRNILDQTCEECGAIVFFGESHTDECPNNEQES